MDIIPYGDHAILINFENKIDLEVNRKVLSLSNALNESKPKGFKYTIPTYCSLSVIYDPLITNYHSLKNEIVATEHQIDKINSEDGRILKIPVCYAQQHAPDLEKFAKSRALTSKEIISIHSAQVYHVYMLGFLPGFAYLGKLDESIKATRLSTPRLKVPAGSIGLAGLQTAIYPCESPGGWQLIGRTPISIIDETKERSFLFKVGDQVKFYEIQDDEYKDIEVDIILNKFDTESLIDVAN